MYAVLGFVLGMDAVIAEFREMGALLLVAFVVLFNFSMLVYDRMLAPMAVLYARRIRPKLRFLSR